ncbi:MAG: glutamate--cysteine ligase [Candidatus Dadabacteria bacterium]|nr:MAG: glutamate--cysteine ligase [Candidatus Dadabacteria bacterium]
MASQGTLALLERLAAPDLPEIPSPGPDTPVAISADLRHSGYKLAPIDLNLFPGGWHNLCPAAIPRASELLRRWAERQGLRGRRVVVLAEAMTRNPAYAENLVTIGRALRGAGWDVDYIATLDDDQPVLVPTMTGDAVELHPLRVEDGCLLNSDGEPADWAFSNNDFTSGVPALIESVRTPIAPPPRLGWHQRRKRAFFEAYDQVATDWASRAGIDPWVLIPETVAIDDVDFWNQQGLDRVADAVEAMLARIQAEYDRRQIDDQPFVVVKDEAGTFGMGVLTVDDAEVIRNPNRKTRQKMQRGKAGRPITSVLVQEGVYTRDLLGDCVAEPVAMAVDGVMTGGFFRYHCSRTETENLNAKGMVFARLCCATDPAGCPGDCHRDDLRYRAYGRVIELAAAAAAEEVAQGAS